MATTRLRSLDPRLFTCLQDPSFRREVRQNLVTLYFPPREQIMLHALTASPPRKSLPSFVQGHQHPNAK